jgi:kynureninase
VHGPEDDLIDALDDDVALVTLSHVAYTSGYLYDMARITAAAHDVGALVVWDLSHSAGAVPIDLSGADVDMAVGCTYKYLNGGPGAPAFLHVRDDLHDSLTQPVTGWFAHARPFDFAAGYDAAADLGRFLTGTPPMISLALIEPGVDLLLEAGMEALRAKSTAQTGHLIDRCEADLTPLGFSVKTPVDPTRRGSHVSLGHPDALGIDLALIEEFGVLPDFRPPDHIRLGVAPLYTRFADIDTAVTAMTTIVGEDRHQKYSAARPTVV